PATPTEFDGGACNSGELREHRARKRRLPTGRSRAVAPYTPAPRGPSGTSHDGSSGGAREPIAAHLTDTPVSTTNATSTPKGPRGDRQAGGSPDGRRVLGWGGVRGHRGDQWSRSPLAREGSASRRCSARSQNAETGRPRGVETGTHPRHGAQGGRPDRTLLRHQREGRFVG